MIADLKEMAVAADASLRQVMEVNDSTARRIAPVTDDSGILIATVTDRDVRRGLLKGLGLEAPVSEVMHPNLAILLKGVSAASAQRLMQERRLNHIPVVDPEGRLVALALHEGMTGVELEESLGLSLGERALMVTLHPESASGASPRTQMAELLAALKDTPAQLVFTTPNADNEGRVLFGMIEDFVAHHPRRACVHTSLGQRRYLSALAEIQAVVGNSSSGLLEVPAFGKGTVNIGARQDGRLRAASVVDCPAERGAIAHAIAQVLTPAFRAAIKGQANPYGDGGASARTVASIEDWLRAGKAPGPKRFHNLPATEGIF